MDERATERRTLVELLDSAKHRKMSPEEMETQRINFAAGNLPAGDKGSVDTVRAAAQAIKQS